MESTFLSYAVMELLLSVRILRITCAGRTMMIFFGLLHGSSRDHEFAAHKHGYVDFPACLYHVLHVLLDP